MRSCRLREGRTPDWSAVPAHAQLAYLLECTAYVGELSRMVQFKEKGRGKPMTRASVFTYPCLMAADILLYGAHRVPVGGDQDQHVELARDLAIRFNCTYGQTFVVPELHRAPAAGRVRDLLTPTAKMSKSDPDEAGGLRRTPAGWKSCWQRDATGRPPARRPGWTPPCAPSACCRECGGRGPSAPHPSDCGPPRPSRSQEVLHARPPRG